MSEETPQIEIGNLDGALYIGLSGRATQRTCPTAAALIQEYLNAHAEAPKVTIDLSGSEWVDSTFAGWLVGLQRRMARGGGTLRLANCSPRCRGSLEKLQLAELFQYAAATRPQEARRVECAGSDRPTRRSVELMIEAHQSLCAVGPANARMFEPIVRVLQEQLKKL